MIKEESGHLTSDIAYKNNNITGMKMPKIRETKAIKSKNGYAYFASYEDCIDDLNLYFERYIVPKNLSRRQAALFLEKHYAYSEGYADRLLKLI